jgi:hypothetical protein
MNEAIVSYVIERSRKLTTLRGIAAWRQPLAC